MTVSRRGFLQALGAGLGLAATPAVVRAAVEVVEAEAEPVRRYWAVPGNAPVGPGDWSAMLKRRYGDVVEPLPEGPVELRAFSHQAVILNAPAFNARVVGISGDVPRGSLDAGQLLLMHPNNFAELRADVERADVERARAQARAAAAWRKAKGRADRGMAEGFQMYMGLDL